MVINDLADGPIPRLDAVRRVPTRYQYVLPLEVIKRHQCLVLGAARGVLTVAITDTADRPLIHALEKYTGRHIFTVLIEPARMRILIERLERCYTRRNAKRTVGRPYYLHRVQLHAIVQALFSIR